MQRNDADSPRPSAGSRRRYVFLWSLLMLVLAAAGCSSSVVEVAENRAVVDVDTAREPTAEYVLESPQPTSSPAATADTVTPESAPAAEPTPAPLTDLELPTAPIGFEGLTAPVRGPQPISLEIEGINVRDATVIPVGVNPADLSFEVPPADQVGWYEFGPIPGEPGSAVLAAHIAYNGTDGVFRNLRDVEIGAIVVVGFDDGSTQRYRIEELVEYIKEELPEELFARTGDSQIALITCGGTFNYQLDSYESNTVAVAVPTG